MIEYLLNAIRATAGEEITVIANITSDGEPITEGCGFMLHIDDENMIKVDGAFNGELWTFTIPADATKGLKGRYSYCLCQGGKTLCFREPFYLL